MVDEPLISLVVTTYEQPWHLRRVLESIRCQTIADRIEVIVTDDGSLDETKSVVQQFGKSAPFPVSFVTGWHRGFRPAVCRNRGVTHSSADFLLFLDGDCLVPSDHLERHYEIRKLGVVTNTYCVRLDPESSDRIALDAIRDGSFQQAATFEDLWRLRIMQWKSAYYNAVRHPKRPALRGGNIGVFREDYVRVNGMDERFCGWGGEDDDLGLRLRRDGVRIRYILDRTRTYHLWHPPRRPSRIRDGSNSEYLMEKDRPIRCRQGLRRNAA